MEFCVFSPVINYFAHWRVKSDKVPSFSEEEMLLWEAFCHYSELSFGVNTCMFRSVKTAANKPFHHWHSLSSNSSLEVRPSVMLFKSFDPAAAPNIWSLTPDEKLRFSKRERVAKPPPDSVYRMFWTRMSMCMRSAVPYSQCRNRRRSHNFPVFGCFQRIASNSTSCAPIWMKPG
jgi:hypothetical protein